MTAEREWTAADFRRDAAELQEELNADARAETRDAAGDWDGWVGTDFDRPDSEELRWIADERKRLDKQQEADGGR